MSKWLLAVYAEPGSKVTEEEFNKWYDEEHIPVRLKTSIYANAARYKSISDAQPKASYLALYELASEEAIGSPENQAIVENASANEKDIISRLETLQFRLYKPIIDSADMTTVPSPPSQGYARFMNPTMVSVSPEHEKEFNEWFHEDHIPMWAKVPGWVRTRRYTLAMHGDLAGSFATPPNYLALNETSEPNAAKTEEYKVMTESEGMKKIVPWLTEFDERHFELYRDFGRGLGH